MQDTKQKFDKLMNYSVQNTSLSAYEVGDFPMNKDFYVGDVIPDHMWQRPNKIGQADDRIWIDRNSNGSDNWNRIINCPPSDIDVGLDYTSDQMEMDPSAILAEGIKRIKPNKVDKDLVKGNIPYNIKKDRKNVIIYEFACAGYKNFLIQKVKEGYNITFSIESDKDDLVGDEFEYICKGIKNSEEKVSIYINTDNYNLDSYKAWIKSGILTLKVYPYSDTDKKLTFTVLQEHDDEEQLI